MTTHIIDKSVILNPNFSRNTADRVTDTSVTNGGFFKYAQLRGPLERRDSEMSEASETIIYAHIATSII